MKTNTFILMLAGFATPLLVLAADADPKTSLTSAAKKLGDQPNYSWKMTVEVPNEPIATIDGKLEKDNAMFLALARGEVGFDGVLKGSKGAIKTQEGWKALSAAAEEGPGPTQFVAQLLQNFKPPHAEVADLAGRIKDLKLADAVYAGTLSEDAAKELLMYRTRPHDADVEIKGSKGSAKFWVADGAVSKYELKLRGTLSANGNERELDRTITIVIKDVGTTKVSVPEEAAKML
jgi:hypothetical protein